MAAFVNARDAAYSVHACNNFPDMEARALRAEAALAVAEERARFLVERIDELDWSDFDVFQREWNGHVLPALARIPW